MSGRRETARQTLALDALTVVVLAAMLWPMTWVFVASFKPEQDIMTGRLWPVALTFAHYGKLLTRPDFLLAIRNSLVVGVSVAVVTCALALPAAYALSRFSFRGRAAAGLIILGTQMLPSVAVLVPTVVILRQIGLINTLTGLTLTHLALGLPIAVWLLKSYIDALPRELEEAALMDGCGRVGALGYVVIPLIRPAIVAVGTFAFVLSWGEFIMALAVISKTEIKTLPLALQALFDPYSLDWGELMAGGVVIAAPAVALFLVFRRQLVGGLTAGGIKG